MRARSTLRSLLLCLAVVALLALPGGALGAVVVKHEAEGSFDGSETPGGPFNYLVAMETDASGGPNDGDVWVADLDAELANARVVLFDESGKYAGVEIDGSTTPAGSFNLRGEEADFVTDGLAVDDSSGPNSGDLYVADAAHGVVDRFDGAGHFICQITAKAIPGTSECNGLAGSATPQGGFVPNGLEVDPNTGTLYVTDFVHDVIDTFSPSGAYIGQIADPHLKEPAQIDFDSAGNMYVASGSFLGPESISEYDPAGNFLRVAEPTYAAGMTVDRATDELYVSKRGEEMTKVTAYDGAGNPLETLTVPEVIYLSLTVSPQTGKLYGGHFSFFGEGSRVDIFNPTGNGPVAKALPAGAVEEVTATLHGEVEPTAGGEVEACRFEYGTDSFARSAPCEPATPYAAATAVSAALSGLEPSTTYQFRLSASGPPTGPYPRAVPSHSETGTFVTVGHPTIAQESADGIERYAATLHAMVAPHGFPSQVRFEFVDAAHYAESGFAGPATRATAPAEIGEGMTPVPVTQAIEGLALGTTYYYRAVAVNSRGEEKGPPMQLKTLPVATIEREWAYAHLTSARLEAQVNPFGLQGRCTVQYVDDAGFQSSGYATAASAPCAKELSGSNTIVAWSEVTGLATDTSYHFHFVISNASGTETGADQTFKTFGVESFSVEALDKEGNPYTQAGGHPYEKIISYHFNHSVVLAGADGSVESLDAFVRDVITEQPPGQTGVIQEEATKCPGHLAEEQACPADTRVGTLNIEYLDGGISTTTKPLYNIVPPEGIASRFATTDPYVTSDSSVRSEGDYGITSSGSTLSEEARVIGLSIVVWGIPAEHIEGGNPSAVLRAPTSCEGPQTARVRVDTWEDPGNFVSRTTEIPATTGCDKLQFHPSIEWKPTTAVADSPTGLHVDIHQPQETAPHSLAFSDLRGVVMNPAGGMIFNPSGAAGLEGCGAAQIALNSQAPARCPDASKVGTVEIDTSLVDHPLRGSIYMATPFDNKFHSMFAIYLVVADPQTGIGVKLAGEVATDPKDGTLTANFAEEPQMPIEDFKLDFFGGPRAMLRTPQGCGTYVTESTVTPWSAPQSGPPAHPSDSYQITSAPNGNGCVAGEAGQPARASFEAGTAPPKAGAYSPFVFRLRREDGTQQFGGVSVAAPAGLLGKLAGIPRCDDAAVEAAAKMSAVEELASPSCPASSRVGSVVVGAGAGSQPLYVSGEVFVSGPYKGAEVSLAIVMPAKAGPFDLGTVVVREPLKIDLESGRLEVESDPLPTILDGVSLDVRSIEAKLDRPGFIVNPTRCELDRTTATVTSKAGAQVQVSAPFRAGGCRDLGFAPKVGLQLLGNPHRRGHPALKATVTLPAGNANIRSVAVAMPPSEFLDNRNLGQICVRAQFLARACPKGSIYGYAQAWSPLLDRPLTGPIYMRSQAGGLPVLVADLDGEFRLTVAGQIGSEGGHIGANITGLPDVPVSKFVMTLLGRKRGLLQNSTDLCTHPTRGNLRMEAQNGKVVRLHPRLRTKCPRR
jgi:hypothetical protein